MFFECSYDKDGIRSDPDKVEAIWAMPAPACLCELQECIGMVTYLSKFIWKLSDFQEPLQSMTKNVQFNWTASYEKQFNIIKQAIPSTATLRYIGINKPVTLQVDALKIRLGVAILQDDSLVAYASKSLTGTEHWWANIEHKAYALVFGCE